MPEYKPDPTRELEAWYEGKILTKDWFTSKVPQWRKHLKGYTRRPIKVLELGSYEGRSAIFMLNFFPQSHLTCVDVFGGDREARFDENLREFGERVTKVKGRALAILDELLVNKKQFHLVYLDAGKRRDLVLANSVVAWTLLRNGGSMIWDDYKWGLDKPSESRPKDAIDQFMQIKKGEYDLLWKGAQVAIRKKLRPEQPVELQRLTT